MRKYKAIAAVTVLLAVPAICSAVVIGDFESSLDDWVVNAPGYTSSYSATGVTLGSESLNLANAGGNWLQAMEKSVFTDATVMNLLSTGGQVTMDITGFGGDPEIPGWWLEVGIYINCDGYWSAMSMQGVTINGTPQAMTFDIVPAAQTALANAGTYAGLGVVGNGSGAGYEFYVDNIQVIPEPATLGLLALGGLGVYVRRRLM